MLIYNTLEETSIESLHETFVEAFSDYQVKMDLPVSKLRYMLQRRGYVPKVSMGAFNNDSLVGFILNGIRKWDGKLTAYDTGTGVIVDYRKQGITRNMFSNLKELLREMEIEQYLLEVIQTNTAAVKLYMEQGFEILRDLICYKLDKSAFKGISTAQYKVQHIEMFDENTWREIKKFWDCAPSWQNSIDSINAVPDAFIYSVVKIDDLLVGYGIIDRKTGDIPQIAVDKNYRGNGIGKAILTDLINSTEANYISVLNVDDKCTSAKNFLSNLGFDNYVNQYEMSLKL